MSLNVNAHVLLCIDKAIYQTFKKMETLIDVSKLTSENASHEFNSPNCSIWYLGLIAFAKLLSFQRSKESISLYTDCNQFLEGEADDDTAKLNKNLLKEDFKGFHGNRPGKIGEISYTTIEHSEHITAFFYKEVNEHSYIPIPIKQILRIEEFEVK